MLKTQNYGFNKPELSDSPPDITVMNSNWDTIDKKIKENTDNINKNNIDMYHLSKFNRNLDDLDDLFLLSGDKYTIYNVRDKTPINSPIEGFVYGTIEYIPTTEGNGNRILIASGRGTLLGAGRKWFCTVRNDGVPYDKGWYEFATVDRSFVAKKDLFIALGTMDLNQAKTIGSYLCVETSSIYYENKPPFIGWFTMLIYEGGTGAIIQEAIQNSGGERCYREFNGAVWSDWKKIITSNNVSNPNLLINGDFQVWQRGIIFEGFQFSIPKYTSDRWCINTNADDFKVEKTSKGMKITKIKKGSATWSFLIQNIETSINIKNKKVTFSAKISDCIKDRTSIFIGYGKPTAMGIIETKNISDSGVANLTVTTRKFEDICVGIDLKNLNEGESIEIEWTKLELGEISTPLSPRSYREELALCQRYCVSQIIVGLPYITNFTNLWFFIPLSEPLRMTPSLIVGNMGVMLSGVTQTGFTFSNLQETSNGVYLLATKINHGLTKDIAIFSSTAILDAEIY